MSYQRLPNGQPFAPETAQIVDATGRMLVICGGAAIGFLLAVTAGQWIAPAVTWDRLIAFALGFVACLVAISLFIGFAALIVSNPRHRS